MSHDVYQHADGATCILVEDGTWFVPLDAGGEGYPCEKQHGGQVDVAQIRKWLTLLDGAHVVCSEVRMDTPLEQQLHNQHTQQVKQIINQIRALLVTGVGR